MILKAFSIYDIKTEAYMRPFFCITSGEAIRVFTDLTNEAGSPFNKHPTDYHLFEIGAFDDGTGHLESDKDHDLGSAAQYLEEK